MENEKELNTKWKPNGTYDSQIDQKGSKTKKSTASPSFTATIVKKTLTDRDEVKEKFAIADTWQQVQNGQLKTDAREKDKKARENCLLDRFK